MEENRIAEPRSSYRQPAGHRQYRPAQTLADVLRAMQVDSDVITQEFIKVQAELSRAKMTPFMPLDSFMMR